MSTCLLLLPFNGLFSWTTWVRWYRKGKTSLDLNEARDDEMMYVLTVHTCMHMGRRRFPPGLLVNSLVYLCISQHCAKELHCSAAVTAARFYLLHPSATCYTHTHTHTFSGLFSGSTWVSRYQKGKTSLDFTEARDSEWQWHQLGHMQVCTSLQTDNHTSTPPLSFLQAGCPSCRPTNSVKALKASSCTCIEKMLSFLDASILERSDPAAFVRSMQSSDTQLVFIPTM